MPPPFRSTFKFISDSKRNIRKALTLSLVLIFSAKSLAASEPETLSKIGRFNCSVSDYIAYIKDNKGQIVVGEVESYRKTPKIISIEYMISYEAKSPSEPKATYADINFSGLYEGSYSEFSDVLAEAAVLSPKFFRWRARPHMLPNFEYPDINLIKEGDAWNGMLHVSSFLFNKSFALLCTSDET